MPGKTASEGILCLTRNTWQEEEEETEEGKKTAEIELEREYVEAINEERYHGYGTWKRQGDGGR